MAALNTTRDILFYFIGIIPYLCGMKPKRIILIRHGESEANVNRYLFGSVPDYTIELTQKVSLTISLIYTELLNK